MKAQISDLFYSCFGQRTIGSVWDWAYLDNPSGDPVVTVCYEGDQLVGHYAIVPMPLSNGSVRKNSYISMTTMISETHRKYGLFTQLAQECYRIAEGIGVDCVFGFPNSQSTPGFRKRLNWSLPDTDYVATIDKETLLKASQDGHFDKTGLFSLELSNPIVRSWRLSRPGASYTFDDGLALKLHEDCIDLLWWDSAASLGELPDGIDFNVLIPASSGLQLPRRFDYQFGGIGLGESFNEAAINREMVISDLF